MSTILLGVLRMPPACWSDDPIDVAQRHAIYLEAADLIERLTCDLAEADRAIERQREIAERWRSLAYSNELRVGDLTEERECSRPPTSEIGRKA